MKPAIVLLTALLAFNANAQLKTDSSLAKPIANKINAPLKTTQPVLKPAATTTSKTSVQSKTENSQAALTDADYFLSGAVIKISTGGDNKEANTSTASVYVRPRKSNGAVAYQLNEYASELPLNQTAELRLDRVAALTSPQNSLQYFKQNGLSIVVAYCNKTYCTDAWKINGITLILEFRDANGNPAGNGYASKTISFPVSSGTLGFIAGCNPFWVTDARSCGHSDQLQKMLLKTDEYLNPLPAQLLTWWKDDVN